MNRIKTLTTLENVLSLTPGTTLSALPGSTEEVSGPTTGRGPSAKLFGQSDKTSARNVFQDHVRRQVMEKHVLARFRKVFERYIGAGAIDELRLLIERRSDTLPIVAVAGQSLTGKSTATELCVGLVGGKLDGTGSKLRDKNVSKGRPIEQVSAAQTQRSDAELDFAAAKRLASGEVNVLEGRMAGLIAILLRALGHKDVTTVIMTCDAKERALRCLAREFGEAARGRVESQLHDIQDGDLGDYLAAMATLPDAEAQELAKRAASIASRDRTDRARLKETYGLDFMDRKYYDLVVDSTRLTKDQVAQTITSKLRPAAGVAEKGSETTMMPGLLKDWRDATVEAAVLEHARRTYANKVDDKVRSTMKKLGRELDWDEFMAIQEEFDAKYLRNADAKVRPGLTTDAATRNKTIVDSLSDYAPRIQGLFDPFGAVIANDPAARRREAVLWEDDSVIVLADRNRYGFTRRPQVLVVPKAPMNVPWMPAQSGENALGLTAAPVATLVKLKDIASKVEDALSRVTGCGPSEIWINPPHYLTVKQLHVHVEADLPEWPPGTTDEEIRKFFGKVSRELAQLVSKQQAA